MDEQTGTDTGPRRGWRRGVVYGLLGAAALAALLAARPIAAAAQNGGWHRMCSGRWGHHRSPEALRDHVQVAVKWALREVDATDEQQEQVNAILGSAVGELESFKQRHHHNREALAAQLAAGEVDRGRLEALRKAELALADEASRRLLEAVADAAEVLTPEQRRALVEHAHRGRH